MRPTTFLPVLLATAVSAPCAGCYTSWDIPVREVNRLDGYRAPAARVVLSRDGEEVTFDQDTQLRFQAGSAVRDLRGHFDRIDVHAAPDEWWLSGTFQGDGQPIRVDLRKVTEVTAKRYSPGKTAVAVLVPVLAAGVIVGVTFGVLVATIPRD
jgi:hypothetical protein